MTLSLDLLRRLGAPTQTCARNDCEHMFVVPNNEQTMCWRIEAVHLRDDNRGFTKVFCSEECANIEQEKWYDHEWDYAFAVMGPERPLPEEP